MSFGPDSLRNGAATGNRRGAVDHRLARLTLISEYRKGRLARHQVCDAHPELVRAAREIGEQTRADCPICEEDKLVLVTYVFGPRLPPFGRCITTKAELRRLDGRVDDLNAYVVEVCRLCSWHHLLQVLPLGGRRRTRSG